MFGNASQNKEVLSLAYCFPFLTASFLKRKKRKKTWKCTWKWNVCPSLCCHQFTKKWRKRQFFLLEIPSVKDFWLNTIIQLCRINWVLRTLPIKSIVNHLWSLSLAVNLPIFCSLSTLEQNYAFKNWSFTSSFKGLLTSPHSERADI